jgi:magnesium transporter
MHTVRVCRGDRVEHGVPLEHISEVLAEPASLVWLDLPHPDDAVIAVLQQEFGFHGLAIEDAVRHHERPKIDVFADHLLVIFYAAAYRDTAGAAPQIVLTQLSLFIGRNYLVSIHRDAQRYTEATAHRWESGRIRAEHSITGLLHDLLDTIVDDYFTVTDQMVEWVEELENTIFGRFRSGAIQEIFALKKDLLLLRRVVAPERDVMNVLLRERGPLLNDSAGLYLQDVYDHLVRVTDTIDTYRDLLSNALDSYLSLQANDLNQLIKTLTLSSVILMSCALIAGIYGMNFHFMPELGWFWGYPFALLLMVCVSVILMIVFRRRHWW